MDLVSLVLVLTSLTASSVLGQEENEKNCDFECPTKGKILIMINYLSPPYFSLLTRREFR